MKLCFVLFYALCFAKIGVNLFGAHKLSLLLEHVLWSLLLSELLLEQQMECLKCVCVCVSAKIDEETSLDLSIATNHHSILYAETPSHSMREGVANSTE